MFKTYLNRKGVPIIRKCSNCVNFINIDLNEKTGYCKIKPMLFAFTHERSVYTIVKDFYLCEEHRLVNEDVIEFGSEPIDLEKYLMERNATKKLNKNPKE